MSENEKNPTHGEPISEEQLDDVSGGGGTGDVSDPYHDMQCWFRSEGEMREDGRTKCKSQCKGKTRDGSAWYICNCWGSQYCIDKWHKPCGKYQRKIFDN